MPLLHAGSRRLFYVIALIGSGSAPAYAAGAAAPAPRYESKWGVGLGVGIERSPYQGVGNDTAIFPLVSVENRYVRFSGTTLDAKLPSAGPVDFALRAHYDLGGGYKASDSPYLSGMDERKSGLSLGVAAAWHSRLADLSLEWMHATDNGKGNRITLAVEHVFNYDDRWELTPYVGVQYADAKDVDYYFGVKDSESRAGRPRYDGKASASPIGGLKVGYAFTPQHQLFFDLGVRHWGSGVTDSPLVGSSTSPSARLGYRYRF